MNYEQFRDGKSFWSYGVEGYVRTALAPRAPVALMPRPGGFSTVFVYDEKGMAIPMAEVYLVKAERGSMDVIEHVVGNRTDQYGKASFQLPSTTGDEVLLYIVEHPAHERTQATAFPGITARVQMTRASKEFAPEAVVMRERIISGLGMPEMTDEEFLLKLSNAVGMTPAGAGDLAGLWRDGKVDEVVRNVSAVVGLSAEQRATFRSLAEAKDREGVLELVNEAQKPFFVKSGFLIPATFFGIGLLVYPRFSRKGRR
jgi:hypothetical protein